MTRYLVTGAAGFIGTNLCETLRDEGHDVVGFDNLSVSDTNVPLLKRFGVHFIQGDISDRETVFRVFRDVDCVIHLAAMNRAQRSIDDPLTAHHWNITGTVNILEAMRRNNIPKIVFSSSSSVYAGRGGVLREDDPLAPPHPYGVGKLAAEHYVRVYSELFGIRSVTLRLFSVYGPYQLGSIDKAGVVAKYIVNARTGKPLPVYGDGKQLRNFTYVEDVVRSIILAAESRAAEGHVINIANPNEITVSELAEITRSITDNAVTITHEPPLRGDPPRNAADVTKARELLKYIPEITFEEGIRRTLAWYDRREYENGCENERKRERENKHGKEQRREHESMNAIPEKKP
jgi:UDP-glucose 4-epimerase